MTAIAMEEYALAPAASICIQVPTYLPTYLPTYYLHDRFAQSKGVLWLGMIRLLNDWLWVKGRMAFSFMLCLAKIL